MPQDTHEQISLNKYISSSGFCSRREADKLIEQGRVTINYRPATLGMKVHIKDSVEIDGEPIKASTKRPIYIALNKPVGITSTTDPKDKTNIVSFLNYPKRVFPIGRLDKDSDGLIFLTNDGDIVNKILRASNHHEKEYIVTVNRAIGAEFIKAMGEGVPILGTTTKPCFVRQEGNKKFRIILVQGLNRQIRRMCEYLGYDVIKLTRVRIMNIKLESTLPTGKWRFLTTPEIDKMNELVLASSKTDEEAASPKKEKRRKEGKPVATTVKPAEKQSPPAKAIKPKEKKQQKSAAAKPENKEASTKPAKKSTSYKEWRNKRNY
ncbi:MAG: 23S rRNA pseudouridine(2604) synthase RluF [Sphingobacteriales bacterium]|nr:MAG: 23S rRNA pseudouridine(2604) synthase RluF [Sphingobacteriales bacterium]